MMRLRGRTIPVIRQMSSTDCGPAALAMVLAYYGRRVVLDEVRRAVQPGREGSSAEALLEVGKTYGLRGRSVSLDIDQLRLLPVGAILHWQFRHYVVLEKIRRTSVDVVDPASGHRTVPLTVFRRHFTGVALIFDPSDTFVKTAPPRRRVASLFAQVLEHRATLAWLIVVSILVQLLSAAMPLLTGVLIDQVVPRRDYSLLSSIATAYCALQIFNAGSAFVREHLSIHLRVRLEAMFAFRFMEHLVDLPYEFFQQRTSGDLMMRLGSNTTVREILTSTLLSTVLDGLMASTYLLLLVLFSVRLTAAVVVFAGLRLAVVATMRAKQRKLLAENLENQARTQTAQVEMLTAMETLKAMGVEHRAVEAWSGLFVDGLNVSIRSGRLGACFNLGLNLLSTLSTLALTFYGGYLVLEGAWTLGSMMAFTALAGGFLGALNNLASSALRFQTLEVYLERLNDVWETAPEQNGTEVTPERSLRGAVTLDTVSFRYSAAGPRVIDLLSLSIPAGARVAIVGPTGSGQSSLARLIAGLYQPTSGRVLLDGADFATLDRRWVRRQFGIVTQDTQLFGGSIRRNIAFIDPTMSLDRVVNAAKIVCLHDEILAMSLKYDTPLSDRGLSLSGGQRQRLAIARAVAAEPRILILDEATSHLDGVTEQRLNANLKKLRCTQIVIAHRLNTVQDADMILVLDAGRVVETGDHQSLMRSAGRYAKLVGAPRQFTWRPFVSDAEETR